MEKCEEPVVVARQCGGWLARSPEAEPVKIAVVAASPEEAAHRYGEALSAWKRNLSSAEYHA